MSGNQNPYNVIKQVTNNILRDNTTLKDRVYIQHLIALLEDMQIDGLTVLDEWDPKSPFPISNRALAIALGGLIRDELPVDFSWSTPPDFFFSQPMVPDPSVAGIITILIGAQLSTGEDTVEFGELIHEYPVLQNESSKGRFDKIVGWFDHPDDTSKNGEYEVIAGSEATQEIPVTPSGSVEVVTRAILPSGMIGPGLNIQESVTPDSELPVTSSGIYSFVLDKLGLLVAPPDYTSPSAGWSGSSQGNTTVERGSDLSNMVFNITFNKQDAGEATGYRFRKNGTEISTDQNNTVSETNLIANAVFQGSVDYEQGPIKENELGIEDDRGRIEAGSVNTPNRTITVRERVFYGAVAEVPTTSEAVRALSPVFDNATNVDLATGTTHNIFVIAMPASKSLDSVVDTGGSLPLTITSSYVLTDSAFTVKDAGGNDRTYKLYVFNPDNAYNPSTTHRFNFS